MKPTFFFIFTTFILRNIMSKPSLKKTGLEFALLLFLLLLMASIISYFKSYHYYLGVLLLVLILIYLILSYKKVGINKSVFWLSAFGIFFTSITGFIVEKWGTYNGFWIYLGIPKNIEIPFWVPFAWGLAYKVLYRAERILIQYFSSPIKKWIFCVMLPASVIPVIGEVFVIYFGTWKYTWQPQYLGMPLIAIVLLCLFHLSIVITMCKICQKFSIYDPVYSKLVSIK